MFADALDLTILLADAEESGALGAAMCAAAGTGMHDSLEKAATASVRVTKRLEPDAESHEQLEAGYAHYRKTISALEGVWGASAAPF